jgi:hypothetical protein
LAELAAKVREDQGIPLTIIVDELDRCRPDFALGLLERIKHLFDVENVAFVLLVNLKQIESYVQTVYGDKDARSYLLKFANLFVDLPNKQSQLSQIYEKGRAEYCQTLFSHYEFSNKEIKEARLFVETLGNLANHFALTLREIEKVFTVMAIYYSSKQAPDDFMIPMLAVLKVKCPPLYQQLSTGSVSVNQFFKETGLDQNKQESAQGFSQGWIIQILKYCLMSDAELSEALRETANTKIISMGTYRFANFNTVKRQGLIPFFCGRLDRFSLDPRS